MAINKDKEEVGSLENESDSNSTTTPKTVVSTTKPESSSTSDTTDRSTTPYKTRSGRSITPVSTHQDDIHFAAF